MQLVWSSVYQRRTRHLYCGNVFAVGVIGARAAETSGRPGQ